MILCPWLVQPDELPWCCLLDNVVFVADPRIPLEELRPALSLKKRGGDWERSWLAERAATGTE